MKKKGFTMLFAVTACVLMTCALVFAGCGDTGKPKPQAGVTLDRTSVELAVGEMAMLTAEVTDSDAAVTWSSSDVGIVHVDGGVLTAVAVGTATITAKAEDAQASATVTVTDNNLPIISLGRDSVELVENGSGLTLEATVAYGGKRVESEISWETGDASVVTVAGGVLTPAAAGTTTVKASTTYLGKYAEAVVAVSVVPETNVTLSQDRITLKYTEDTAAQVTAAMTVGGEAVEGAVYAVAVEGDAVTAAVEGNIIALTVVTLGDATVAVRAQKGEVTVSTQLSVTVERADKTTGYRFEVNTHAGDVALEPTEEFAGARGIYVGGKLVSVEDRPLVLKSDWLAQQVTGSTVEALIELPDYNAIVTLEFIDEVRPVTLMPMDGCRPVVSEPADGEGITGFRKGDVVQAWSTAPGAANWEGSTVAATIGGSHGDMNGYDWWIFDVVYAGSGDFGDQNGDLLYFILCHGNDSTVTFRVGGATREGLNIYDANGDELKTMPQRNVRYTVVVSLTGWTNKGQYIVMGHYTPDMTAYVGNNMVCSDAYYREHIESKYRKISLDRSGADCYVNDTVTLVPTVVNGDANAIVWESSDETVATVMNGVVTAHKRGTATISAAIGEVKAECIVSVKDKLELAFDTDQVLVSVGKTGRITPEVKFNGVVVTSASITYAAVDPAVASVENGTVTGLQAGRTQIKVTAVYEGVTVEKPIDVKVVEPTAVTASAESVEIYTREGQDMPASAAVTAQMYVDGHPVSDAVFTAEADAAGIVTITVTDNEITIQTTGVIGTAVITITATRGGGAAATCTVNVTVNRGKITADTPYEVDIHWGDQIIDLSGFGEVQSISDGNTPVSAADNPAAVRTDWLAGQTVGATKQLTARFENFDVVLTVKFTDNIRGVHMHAFTWAEILDEQSGEGIPGFGKDDTVQRWRTGSGAGWEGSTLAATIGGKHGDMNGYDWWIFDFMFTGDVTADSSNTWMYFYLRHGNSTECNLTANGPSREGVNVYDQNGVELVGLPQKNVRYTVRVKLTGYTALTEYIVIGHHTVEMIAYIGNNFVCSDAYYQEHLQGKFPAAPVSGAGQASAGEAPAALAVDKKNGFYKG